MNREFLFRGKDEKTGAWRYGFYAHLPSAGGSAHIIYEPAENPDESNHTRFVDPATVGQYTGLTDRNGKRIFEGDTLRYDDGEEYDDNERAVVIWEDSGFWLEYHNGQTEPWLEQDWAHSNVYLEVIGNIHDNPEILKEASRND